MRKHFLLLVLAFSVLIARADEYPYLALQTSDGEVKTMSVQGLTLSYADGTLTAANTQETALFTTATLARMYFTDTATGLISLAAAQSNVAVEVFTADGRSAGRFPSVQAATQRLPKGVYVVKADNGNKLKISLQ